MDINHYINFFVTLLVICNPIGALPALLSLTQKNSFEKRRKVAKITTLTVGLILVIVTWTGTPFLLALGLNVEAFQVAGGFVVFLLALSMLRAEQSPLKYSQQDDTQEPHSETIAVSPLAMPVIAGPGAISAIVVQTNLNSQFSNLLVLTLISILVTSILGFILYFSDALQKILGNAGMNIFMRIGGLILATNAINTIAMGAKELLK